MSKLSFNVLLALYRLQILSTINVTIDALKARIYWFTSILLNNLRKIQIKVKLIECTEEKKLKSDYDTFKKSESKLDNLQVNIFEIENELEDLVTNSKRLLDFIKHY